MACIKLKCTISKESFGTGSQFFVKDNFKPNDLPFSELKHQLKYTN